MINRKKCLYLLKKYDVKDNLLRHSLKVNEISMFIGKKLKAKGEKIDLELLECGSLLHDIGKRLGDKLQVDHIEAGVKILIKEKLNYIIPILTKHYIGAVNELRTWEEKIVYYADKRVMEDVLVSLDERLKDLKKRYPWLKDIIKKSGPKIKRIEKEIFDKIEVF
ncbi:MAG: HD domain-containing protein [Candidatus Nanoarchaeia archaeon]|nr:HD domain-containing protein [Candidatus Nanoarchaeia archaeon]